MHPWQHIELGDHIERHFRAVIEIPKGSKIKYENFIEPVSVTERPSRPRYACAVHAIPGRGSRQGAAGTGVAGTTPLAHGP